MRSSNPASYKKQKLGKNTHCGFAKRAIADNSSRCTVFTMLCPANAYAEQRRTDAWP